MTDQFGQKALFRSAMLVTGSTYVTYATGLLVSTLIARSLGPTDYGSYSYLVWLSGILVLFCTNGLTTSGIRFVSECIGRGEPDAASSVYGWLLRRQHVSLAIVAIVFVVAVPYIEPAGWNGSVWLLAFIALASAFSKSEYMFRASMAKGYGIFSVEAATTNIMSVVGLCGAIVLAVTKQGLYAYLFLFVAVSAGHAILTHLFISRTAVRAAHGPLAPALTARMHGHLWWSILLAMVAAFSNKSIETFLLNKFAGSATVGFFIIAGTLTRGGIDLLSNGLTSVLMPTMSHAFGRGGSELVNDILSNAVRYFQFLGLLLAGAGVLWASPAINLMYGPRYEPAVLVLQVMTLVGGLTLTEGAFGALLSTTDHQRIRAGSAALYVVITAVAAFIFIPHYGLIGAVMAHAISRTLACGVVTGGVIWTFKIRLPWAQLLRLLLASAGGALMSLLALAISPGRTMQIVSGLVYVVVYVVLTLLLRVWNVKDMAMLSTIAARIPLLRKASEWLQRWARLA